jgi:membrane associated rhomboid family serine protease
MRFPVRDVIPSTRFPIVSALVAVALVCLVTLTTADVAWTTATTGAWLLAHLAPLLVLGETVEDRLGHDRYASLLVVATLAGWWVDGRPGLGPTLAVYPVGAVSAAHLALFPTSQLVVSVRIRAFEAPSFVLPAIWLLTAISFGDVGASAVPLAGTGAALLVSAAAARPLRRPDRAGWAYLDRAR